MKRRWTIRFDPCREISDALSRGRMRACSIGTFVLAAFLTGLSSQAALAEVSQPRLKSTPLQQQSISVTVYNNNLGLIKDVRELRLPTGQLELMFEGVASKIDPTSVHIRSLDHPEMLIVLEQNFEYDIISADRLMEKYLGKTLFLVTRDGAKEWRKEARLIGIDKATVRAPLPFPLTQARYIYEIDDQIAINPPGAILMPSLPEGLTSRPSLLWILDNQEAGHLVEVSYLTGGIEWKADYVAVISEDDRTMDLSGWVTVDNRSGVDFNSASLKLVAGDLNRVQRKKPTEREGTLAACMLVGGRGFEERAFFEHHIYDLQRKTTIKNNQTKQIRLMEAAGVAVQKSYVYHPRQNFYNLDSRISKRPDKVGVFLTLNNSEDNNLGIPIPMGIVRAYKQDEDGELIFVGEDIVHHTAEGEEIRVKMGEAFDVAAECIQTEFRIVKKDRIFQSSYEIRVRNHKEEPIVVSVVSRFPSQWEIKETTHEYEKETAGQIRFNVPVERRDETRLMYTVVIRR